MSNSHNNIEITDRQELEDLLEDNNIDADLSFSILDQYNEGKFDNQKEIEVTGIPEIDGTQIIDMTQPKWMGEKERVLENLEMFDIDIDYTLYCEESDGNLFFSRDHLYALGIRLLPCLSYGVLNGGSATSYADRKKNSSFSKPLFSLYEEQFDALAANCTGKPKGITPAFINPDGTPGPSFLELKLRSLLIWNLKYQQITGEFTEACYPFFQMTSLSTDAALKEEYRKYQDSPYLSELIEITNTDILNIMTGIQPMISAFTPGTKPKEIFLKDHRPLPLPGGHGQNFTVLRDIYCDLYDQGKRFVYLGNVDNLGNTVDPASLAIMALSGSQGGFDFSFKTSVDVKGGVLIKDAGGKLNCVDIGPAISKEQVLESENKGKQILFNCATGIFSLSYLARNIDTIIDNLPLRFSEQDKDIGRYSQAEQITWEIISLLESPIIFAVDKFDRFLASKLLIENLLTSGMQLNNKNYPKEFIDSASKLYSGLVEKLDSDYCLTLDNGKWVPMSVEEIIGNL